MKCSRPHRPTGQSDARPTRVLVVGLIAALTTPALCSADTVGPITAVRQFSGPTAQPNLGKSMSDLLIKDLAKIREPCEITVADARKHQAPDVFVDGSVSIAGDRIAWSVKYSDAVTGEILGNMQGNAAANQFVAGTEAFARELVVDLCRTRPGFVLSGRIDEATISGQVCGDLSRPFSAKSPEVAAIWTFTPNTISSGKFVYTAASVGGAPGKGAGTYKIVPGSAETRLIQLAGTGSITSPVGTFSAPITESLTLTPTANCRRAGSR
jgi:hypothetical protein